MAGSNFLNYLVKLPPVLMVICKVPLYTASVTSLATFLNVYGDLGSALLSVCSDQLV